jgi:hypothetical protein
MMRLGNIIGLVVGGLVGYLCSFDIDTSLGSAKIFFYVGLGAIFGWMTGFVFYLRQTGGTPAAADRDAQLAAAIARAEAAEAEVGRLQARVAELQRGR